MAAGSGLPVPGPGAISALAILYDILAGRRQKMAIMNVVWPITGLYFGPFGWWAYRHMGRPAGSSRGASHGADNPGQGNPHKAGIKPFWQTVFVSTSHCGAGCTLGDVAGEWAIFLTGLTLFGSSLLTAYAIDFALAYLLGILFQYFAIVPMRGLGPWRGLKEAVKADTLSLVAFEVGMFAWMALTRLVLFQTAPTPTTAVFWFMMQIAMVVGFLTSYPANWWLVRRGIKEAM